MEVWKDIEGYEGKYQVSNLGNVKSVRFHNGHKEKLLKQKKDRRGYPNTFLFLDGKRKTFSTHRLVAMAFVHNPENKTQVNHINGDKADNRAENIEWCTNDENMSHAVENDLKYSRPVLQFDKVGRFLREWKSMEKAGTAYGVTRQSIFACCNGKSKTCRGYVWRYKGA